MYKFDTAQFTFKHDAGPNQEKGCDSKQYGWEKYTNAETDSRDRVWL